MEKNTASGSETEEQENKEEGILEDEEQHLGEDGEEGTEERVVAEMVNDLEPDAAPKESENGLGHTADLNLEEEGVVLL